MTASLVVEMPGEPPFEVRLDPDVVSVGRAEDNVLSLRDMNVSRHHFSVDRKGEFSVIQDRGSRNGTLVNGVAVLNKVLVEGDRVHVGGSVLTFRAKASNNALPPDEIPRPTAKVRLPSNFGLSPFPGQLRAPGTSPASTRPFDPRPVELSSTDDPDASSPAAGAADSKEPGTRHGGDSPSRRVAIEKEETRWRTLAAVACAVNGELDLDRLLERILDAVLSLVPAKAGFLVLREGEDLRVGANRNATNIKIGSTLGEIVGGEDKLRLSRQICEEAIAKKRPVLTQDAVSDQRLNQFLSVVSLQLKSILCVPFSSNDEVLGVVYLDEPTCDPFDDEGEAVDLVGAFGDLAGIALANARLMAGIAERERLEKELAIAAQIQRSLLPKAPPPVDGLQLAGKTVSALQVGGDLFDYFLRERPQRDVLISIGDVAGKGVGAGLVMATVRALLHAYAELYAKTDELLVQLNAVLSQNLDPGIFVSYLLIRYDQATGLLHYTGAGHEHLILYRPSTGQMEFLRAGGVVLGLVGEIGDKIKEKQMKLRPDDVVVLYTDGATEAQGETTEEFGLERIGDAIKAGPLDPEAIVDRIMTAVKAFTGEDRQLHDDLTVVAIRKT